ncbi:MAG: glycosyltransferase family 9 protein, partial [Bacteroidota bacterium]
NDTGIMNVAAATGTSVLSLFGPTDPSQWAPRSNRHKFLVSRNRDINSITEGEVYDAATELLDQS